MTGLCYKQFSIHIYFLRKVYQFKKKKRYVGLFKVKAGTAVHKPSAKYYQLLGLHGRWWRKWRKIGI